MYSAELDDSRDAAHLVEAMLWRSLDERLAIC